jgi:hypothetical protein
MKQMFIWCNHQVLFILVFQAICGLKQAPRALFSRLGDKLLQLGFVGSKADTSFFLYRTKTVIMCLLIYVDNIIITTSDQAVITYRTFAAS